jgi:hypothetical protein
MVVETKKPFLQTILVTTRPSHFSHPSLIRVCWPVDASFPIMISLLVRYCSRLWFQSMTKFALDPFRVYERMDAWSREQEPTNKIQFQEYERYTCPLVHFVHLSTLSTCPLCPLVHLSTLLFTLENCHFGWSVCKVTRV